jgi:hypothetical protein
LEKALAEIGGVEYHEATFGPDPAGMNRLRAALGPVFFSPNVSAWYLSIKTPLSVTELTPTMQKRQHFELTTPKVLDQGWGGLQLRHEPNPPAGLPDAPDLHYFQVDQSNDPILRQLWESIEAAGELGVSRNNVHLDLTNSTFAFYAILQPKALAETME